MHGHAVADPLRWLCPIAGVKMDGLALVAKSIDPGMLQSRHSKGRHTNDGGNLLRPS